jgi:hypothetical protein
VEPYLASPWKIASFGNTQGGVWDGNPEQLKLPSLCKPYAWHCNYVVGMERKLQMARLVCEHYGLPVQSGADRAGG